MQWSLLPGLNKLSIPSTSRTPTARGEPPSANLLAGPDTPPVCVPFQQIPSLYNSWRTAHTRPGTTSLVNKEVSDLQKVPTPKWDSIYGSSTPEENQEILLYSVFPELTLHSWSAHKSWFWDFYTFCMSQSIISSIWRRALVIAIPKPSKALGHS